MTTVCLVYSLKNCTIKNSRYGLVVNIIRSFLFNESTQLIESIKFIFILLILSREVSEKKLCGQSELDVALDAY